MLRPATPLAILLFVAFALHLLAVLSTPIVKAIPLATFQDVNYGVFGSCSTKTGVCVGPKIGYTPNDSTDFSLPSSARHSLTAILIIHPVACLLTLICFILVVTLHWHSPANSSRFILGLIVLMLPTLLVSLLAFLVDILLFVPHLAWGGWIVLASTILVLVSGVLTCVMRRTLVSRKERKKRIAENAEMSGEDFFNRQNTTAVNAPPPLSQEPTAPMVNGAPGANTLPEFATFDQKRRPSDDDRVPLNSMTTAVTTSSGARPSTADEPPIDRYGAGRGGAGPNRGRGGRMYNGPRDEYGNPLPPAGALGQAPGSRRNSGEQYPRRQYSDETMNSQSSRGGGRGGYPPRGGYGRGGPYGGRGGPGMSSNGRGGPPVGAMVAGAGAGMMTGEVMGRGQRGPPPGYGAPYGPQQGRPDPGQYNQGYAGPIPGPGPGPYVRRRSPGPPSAPGGYGRNPSPGPPSAPGGYGYGSRQASPSRELSYARAESPPPLPTQDQGPSSIPIGQAIEMDASTGSPAATPGFPPVNNPLRESDSDVEGLVGLQQNRGAAPYLSAEPTTPSSAYSSQRTDSYVPARAAWAGGVARHGTPPLGTIQGSPNVAVPPGRRSPPNLQQAPAHTPSRARVNSSDNYYEDVDPRFSSADPSSSALGNIPTLLVPGGNTGDHLDPYSGQQQRHQLQPTSSYDSVNDGPESDASNFTSISQRGVNPEWQAEHNPQGYATGGVPNRAPPQQRDFLLASNPDFEVPGARGGRGHGGRGGRGGGPMPGMI